MNSFFVAHIDQSRAELKDFGQHPVWRTCLRTIIYFDEQNLDSVLSLAHRNNVSLSVLKDSDAYRYLLEVICGLKSEVVGETQVLGQFKAFLQATEKLHKNYYLNNYTVFQNLLQDCKELREKHIHHWGGSSYGSLTRKIAEQTENVCVIGNGQLAQSLLPWMKEKNTALFGRNPKNAGEHLLSIAAIDQQVTATVGNSSLVIAAPVDNSFLKSLLLKVSFQQIIDWRTEVALENAGLPPDAKYHSFQHLAEFMKNEKNKRQAHIAALGEVIGRKINVWAERKLLRPNGWDDLC